MFIELDRTFRKLVDDPTMIVSDDAKLVPSATKLKWDHLLSLHRSIVLSEAGSGKTEEIRHAARRLRADGKAAYFLRLEHISKSFETAFEEGTYEEFVIWLDSTQDGWLLLDSIDESRLRDPLDFEAAIRVLGHRLRPALQRVHLVLTGRTAAWRPATDLALCLRHLPYSEPNKAAVVADVGDGAHAVKTTSFRPSKPEQGSYTIASLDDLSVAQARLFAMATGVSDVDELLESIERADGWSFTTRPLDLMELLEFWKSNGRIGSRLELLRASIDRRLREQDPTRDEQNPLAPDRARTGARLVAAACTLALQQVIAVPDRATTIQGLRLDALLGDWSAKERATLLQRPIFDEEIYGTVRFHHRTTREYLTAEWFAELLKKNTSRRAVESLFFREQYGLVVVPPVLRPVLPWLAILDHRIQERALRVAPEVLLTDGDPSQLLLTTRRQVLTAMCADLARGSPRGPADYSAIQRFAADDLSTDVTRLLCSNKDEESQVFLLRMVWQGRLAGALTEVLEVAFSASAPTYARRVAIRAVCAIGTDDDLGLIRAAFVQEASVLDRDVLAELLETAPRSAATVSWLCDCLLRVSPFPRYSADYLCEGICDFVEQIETTEVSALTERFSGFIEEQPVVERGHCNISTRNAWLLKPAALAVHRLARERQADIFRPSTLKLLHVLPSAKQYDLMDGDDQLDFDSLVQGWQDLNFALFWYAVAAVRRGAGTKEGERVTDWWRAQLWPSFVAFKPTDFEAALGSVSSRLDPDDKLVALSLAFKLYVESGRPAALRHRLKAACNNDPLLKVRLQTLLRPPRQSAENMKFRRMNERWKRLSKASAEREEKDRESWRQHLLANVDRIRNPSIGSDAVSHDQLYLHRHMRMTDQGMTMYSKSDWRSLEPSFGADVAHAFRDGAVAY